MNIRMLKAAAIINGLTMADVSNSLGISKQAFYNKTHGKTEFKLSEIRKLKQILQLNDHQLDEIFFEDPDNPAA